MKQFYLSFLLFVLLPLQLLAQNISVSGRVTDAASGAPLLGVSIMISTPTGQRSGTTTNQNGEYSITAPSIATDLVFTFTGMGTITEPIRGRSAISVQLKASNNELEQVIVATSVLIHKLV